jgi:putative SOS response-associated peptidase YedK
MCGRYGLIRPTEFSRRAGDEFAVYFANLQPRYNIAPSQENPIVATAEDGAIRAATMKWGFVPFWEKAEKPKLSPINARSEEAFSKPMFRQAIQYRRALAPADVFYEWKRVTEKLKVPHAIGLTSGEPFFIASIYEAATEIRPETYALLTTSPNDLLAGIHNRMPVILDAEAARRWISPGRITDQQYAALCIPFPPEKMRAYAVSSLVNNPKNDVEACVTPVLETST